MKFSIIINTHNQPKFLNECVNSCLNQNFLNYEIIIVDTSNKPMIGNYINNTKIKYFHIKEKSKKFPVMNQMHQILYGFKKSKGKYICLLDGDDKFSTLKLKNLSLILNQNKREVIQDIPIFFSKTQKTLGKLKKYKKNYIFHKFIISWPQIFWTSTITCHREILNSFFKKGKAFEWKFLAIDVKLILFATSKYKVTNNLTKLTFKRKHENNLDSTFSTFFSKYFWIRRDMQIEYDYYIKKKLSINVDLIITKIIKFFL